MHILALNGASASGKTCLALLLSQWFNKRFGDGSCCILTEDKYYHPQDHRTIEERSQLNFDHPDAFDHQLLINQLQALKSNSHIDVPEYCYQSHTRLPKTAPLTPPKLLILEGIHVLSRSELLELLDIKLFVKTPLDICLMRRIQRDIAERGRSVDCVVEQYLKTVRPMYMEFIKENEQHADHVVSGHQSRAAMLDEALGTSSLINLISELENTQ